MLPVGILLGIALVGILLSSLLGTLSGTFDLVSILGAVICVVGALVIGAWVLSTDG